MRIVLAGSSFLSKRGGIATSNQEIVRMLGEEGHEFLIVSPDLDCTSPVGTLERYIQKRVGTPIPPNPEDEIDVAEMMFDKIVEFDPEVLISSDHIYLTSLFPCFADHRIRISFSRSRHDTSAPASACRAQDTDWLIALSFAGKQFLERMPFVIPEQVQVIYNMLGDCYQSPYDLIDRKTRENVLRIAFAGGGSRIKSPWIVMAVIKRLCKTDLNWRFVWMGDARKYQMRLHKVPQNRIHFTGHVPRDVARNHIRNAHCLLLPSRSEACPVALLEAMQAGTIPIVSDCPSAMRELVENGVSGFVVPVGNKRQVFKNLQTIACSTNLRKTLMLSARSTYEQKLSGSIWLERMVHLMSNRRENRRLSKRNDCFDPICVLRWHRRPGSWKCPTVSYLRCKFGYPNLSPIIKA